MEAAIMIRKILWAAALAALAAMGCGGGGDKNAGEDKAMAYVTGTVTYLQTTTLPSDAEVHVELQDISVPNAPARTIAASNIVTGGKQVPIPFSIAYDPAEIGEARTYSVHAEIYIEGERRFMSTQDYLVITREAPTDVAVTVMAVKRVAPAPALVGTYWKLTSVGGKDALPAADARREPHLTLLAEESRAIATGGCNQMTGTYRVTEGGLAFSPFASTRMACPDVMQQEHALGQALAATRSYRVDGPVLELKDAKGVVLARFQAAEPEE
jgi:putative lipoprotein